MLENNRLCVFASMDGELDAEYPLESEMFPDVVMPGADGNSLIYQYYNNFGRISLADGTIDTFSVERNGDYSLELCIDCEFGTYAVADKEEKAILLYHVGEEDSFMKIEAVAPLINRMEFTTDGQYLFAYYMDDSIAIYDAKTGECLKEHADFGDSTSGAVYSYEDGYAVKVLGGVYLLNSEFEKTALLPSSAVVMPQMKKMFVIDRKEAYQCPINTTEELIEKSKEILTGLNAFE